MEVAIPGGAFVIDGGEVHIAKPANEYRYQLVVTPTGKVAH